jgi:uncharacterized protein involved in outer membrane biogenesis
MPLYPELATVNKKNAARIALAVLGLLVAITVLALAVIENFDWNRAKPWINQHASAALGRKIEIAGDLALSWERPIVAIPDAPTSWHNLIPWPHLVARDVRVGNVLSAKRVESIDVSLTPYMAHVDQFNFSLNPIALIEKKIEIPLLRFDAPVVNLLRSADGKNNWTFKSSDDPSPWHMELQQVVFSKGSIHLVDAVKHADVTIEVDTINGDPNYGVAWQLHGKLNGETISGSGKAGAVLALQHQTTPYPIAATLHVGKTVVSVEGTVTKPTDLAAIDARLKISGQTMAHLYAISGILLPETPPFSTEGHLIGTLGQHNSHWIYENFKGKVGGSDLGGTFDYQAKPVRPLLSGKIESHLLQFVDLAPLIGSDSNGSKTQRGATSVQPPNKALPVEPFKTDRWTSIDADVKFSAAQVIWKNTAPISKLSTIFHLQDGVLSFLPLNFSIADGSLSSNIILDASGRTNTIAAASANAKTGTKTDANASIGSIKASMKVTARNLKVQQLFPTIKGLPASFGELNGDATLTAVGNSVASLLAVSDGEIKANMPDGTISKLLLEEMGLNLGNIVVTRLFGDEQIKIDCLAADFDVEKGLMNTRSFIVDTDAALIDVDGKINLGQEQIDLTVKPKSKGLRLFSLRAPIYVRGSFLQPKVSIDKGVMAMKAAGAIALTALTPFAAMIPVTNTGSGKSSDCAKLLTDAHIKPVLPPGHRMVRP